MIRIFIGYDRAEPVLFSTLAHSLIARSSRPVSLAPVSLQHLERAFVRERSPLQSTEFSFSRFLVPYLVDYEGWAIFMDNDFLARGDIADLWDLRDERRTLLCVKHDHVPSRDSKFKGAVQTRYARKNWSSLMLMNCAKCTALTPSYVNTASGLDLHQFKWVTDDALIGEIPAQWNHLVGYHAYDPAAKLVHFTEGAPCFPGFERSEYADEWFAMCRDATRTSQADVAALLADSARQEPARSQ